MLNQTYVTKIKQSKNGTEDANLNLAHACFKEGKIGEAERLYVSAFREDCASSSFGAEQAYNNLELAGCTQYLSNRFEDALKCLLRCAHCNPTSKMFLNNVTVIIERFASHIYGRNIEEINRGLEMLSVAVKVINHSFFQTKASRSFLGDRLKHFQVWNQFIVFLEVIYFLFVFSYF